MKRVGVVMIGLVNTLGCAISHDVGDGVGQGNALQGPVALSAACRQEVADAPFDLPTHLSCTGLFSDAPNRVVADNVLSYAPAYLLWADGLDKFRYLFLPKGTKIDASSASQWSFPVGTRLWKEFRDHATGNPVETRIYFKKEEGEWRQSTYEWSDDLSDAKRVDSAKDIMVGSLTHWLPGPNDCETCHKGRIDRVLGFEQVELGLSGASGVTLAQLKDDGLLEGFSGPTEYHIGPDDSNTEAHAMGWMHANCGITCHNENSNSTGQSVDMRLRLDPTLLDGRSTSDFGTLKTTVGVATQAKQWIGKTRIVPGQPEQSWLYTLINQRGDKMQMPPLATYVVDTQDVDIIKKWIQAMPQTAASKTAE
jgi:hypothetical protein